MNYILDYQTKKILSDKNISFIRAEEKNLDEIIFLFKERTNWFKRKK